MLRVRVRPPIYVSYYFVLHTFIYKSTTRSYTSLYSASCLVEPTLITNTAYGIMITTVFSLRVIRSVPLESNLDSNWPPRPMTQDSLVTQDSYLTVILNELCLWEIVPPYILSSYFIQSTLFYLTPEVLLLNTFLFHYPIVLSLSLTYYWHTFVSWYTS